MGVLPSICIALCAICLLGCVLASCEYRTNENPDCSNSIDCVNGKKLTDTVCLIHGYRKTSRPKINQNQLGQLQVNVSMYLNNIRAVNDKERKMTADVSLTFYWTDNRIHKVFSNGDGRGIVLTIESLNTIWHPDLYIWNMKSFDSYSVVSPIDSLVILRSVYWENSNWALEYPRKNTYFQYYLDGRAEIYCNDLMFNVYPMDVQKCSFQLGTALHYVDFVWGQETSD